MFAMVMYFIIYLAFHESGRLHSWAGIYASKLTLRPAGVAGKIDLPADADGEVADVDLS